MNLRYERGHELSGLITLHVQQDGSAEATRSGRGNLDLRRGAAVLTDVQRDLLHSAIEDADLAHLEGSSRPIGDDEVPVLVVLGEGSAQREIRVWSRDAAENARFAAFEAAVRSVVADVLETSSSGRR